MTNPEFSSNPEQRESQEVRENLVEIAQDFLMDGQIDTDVSKMSNVELGEYIQRKFQENLENFFESSGLAEEIEKCKTDEDALHFIANKGEGSHGWYDMLPNLIKAKAGAGMQCTMSSAMLHIALEKMGLGNVRTVSVKGHHVVLRELEDGSIKLYDAAAKSTVEDKLVGYSQVFKPEQISDRAEIEESPSRKGFKFTLDRGQQDNWGGFHMPDEEGKFRKKFYAYDQSIKMDEYIALGNLSELKDDARELGGVTDLPLVDRNDYLRAAADFIRRNNKKELTDEEVRLIGRENPDAVTDLIKEAEKSVSSGQPVPNPFDFIKSDLVIPKEELEPLPDPRAFTGEAALRHKQAKELVAKYPALQKLDINKVEEGFGMFPVHKYV